MANLFPISSTHPDNQLFQIGPDGFSVWASAEIVGEKTH